MWQVYMTYFAAACERRYFFGIPSWDYYLYPDYIRESANGEFCEYTFSFFTNEGGERVLDLTIFSLIGLGILDILLRVGAMVAVGFVVYGGVKYVTSQGEPDKAKGALDTIMNALIGLALTVMAVAIVSFIGNRIGG